MRVRIFLAGLTAGLGLGAGIAAFGERRVIRHLRQTPSPQGWTTPRFPDGNELMVPTDDGAELRVALAGPANAPAIVLVHGLTSNHDDWGPVAHQLVAAGHRVIGVNQRGHGGSTVGSDGFGPERQGRDLGQVLTALELRGVTLVGHSMGGIAALSLLILVPESGADRVERLVLVATLESATRIDRRSGLKLFQREQTSLSTHPVHGRVLARAVFGAHPSEAMVDDALASAARCPDVTRVGASAGLVGYDVRGLLGTIATPTTVVCGTQDRLTPLAENRHIAESIPDAHMVVVPGAGHLVIWEAPEVIVEAIVGSEADADVLVID